MQTTFEHSEIGYIPKDAPFSSTETRSVHNALRATDILVPIANSVCNDMEFRKKYGSNARYNSKNDIEVPKLENGSPHVDDEHTSHQESFREVQLNDSCSITSDFLLLACESEGNVHEHGSDDDCYSSSTSRSEESLDSEACDEDDIDALVSGVANSAFASTAAAGAIVAVTNAMSQMSAAVAVESGALGGAIAMPALKTVALVGAGVSSVAFGATVLTSPFLLGTYRVRNDVVIEVGKGLKLVNGKQFFINGTMESCFGIDGMIPKSLKCNEVPKFITSKREEADRCRGTFVEFPQIIKEGMVCLQYLNVWGTPTGCNGMITYQIEGSDMYLVCVINNPYNRVLQNLSIAVGLIDFPIETSVDQVKALLQVTQQNYSMNSFAGMSFNTNVDGGLVSVSNRTCNFVVSGRMTSLRHSTAHFSVKKLDRSSTPRWPSLFSLNDDTNFCERLQNARGSGNLAAALTITAEMTCFTEKKRCPPGRLTIGDRESGRAQTGRRRTMKVTCLDSQGMKRNITSDKTGVIRLPEGATKVKVRFMEAGGVMIKKIDRQGGKKQWIREPRSSRRSSCSIEEFDLEQGDGVDAVFILRGPIWGGYVAKAWDFGRPKNVSPRSWEWWGDEEEVQRDSISLLPNATEVQQRLRVIEDMNAITA